MQILKRRPMNFNMYVYTHEKFNSLRYIFTSYNTTERAREPNAKVERKYCSDKKVEKNELSFSLKIKNLISTTRKGGCLLVYIRTSKAY